MSPQRAGARILMTLVASALLAACASQPAKPPPQPATVIAQPEPPPTMLAPIVPPAVVQGDPWASLVASFAMQDCADSPLIREKEALFTGSPMHFERMLKRALPLMLYVQKELQAAGIPGEFVMLPMLESSYTAFEPRRRGGPVGMWQLMPRTAELHGVVVTRDYDGRLDPVASTRAAIQMLTAYGKQFGDWRLADLAYNAGPYAVVGALREEPDLDAPGIPDIRISFNARKHLAKLMALSCILREPARFHVSLPKPSLDDELAAIVVPVGTRLARAASMAGIPESDLRSLNPGYRGSNVPASSPRTLLLPANAAQMLASALAVDTSESVAQVSAPALDNAGPNAGIPLPVEPSPPQLDNSVAPSAAATHVKRHRVRKGETLWSIAHEYNVSVGELKRWNKLRDNALQTGEWLRVRG